MSQEIYVNMHGYINPEFGFITPKNITIKLYGYPGLVTTCSGQRKWINSIDDKLVIVQPGQYLFDIGLSIYNSKGEIDSTSYIVNNTGIITTDNKDIINNVIHGDDFRHKHYSLSRLCLDLINNNIYNGGITIHVIACLGLSEIKYMCDYLYKDIFKIAKGADIYLQEYYPKEEINILLNKYFSKFPRLNQDMPLVLKESDENGVKVYNYQFSSDMQIFTQITNALNDKEVDKLFIPHKRNLSEITNGWPTSEEEYRKVFGTGISVNYIYQYSYALYGAHIKENSYERKPLYNSSSQEYNTTRKKYDYYTIECISKINLIITDDDIYTFQYEPLYDYFDEGKIILSSNSTGGLINTDITAKIFNFYKSNPNFELEKIYNSNTGVIIANYILVCDLCRYNRCSNLEIYFKELNDLLNQVSMKQINNDVIEGFIKNLNKNVLKPIYSELINNYSGKFLYDNYLGKIVRYLRTIQ